MVLVAAERPHEGVYLPVITNEPTLLIRGAGRRLHDDSGPPLHLSNFQGSAFCAAHATQKLLVHPETLSLLPLSSTCSS